jgi:hypothetical protein
VRRNLKFHLASDHGRSFRPDRASTGVDYVHSGRAFDFVPGDALVGKRTLVSPIVDGRTLAFICLWWIQRGDGGDTYQIMPTEVRTTGFSLAYSLATALFGGNTPAICTYLIHITNNKAMPGVWMSAAALIGLVAALMVDGRRSRPDEVAENAERGMRIAG